MTPNNTYTNLFQDELIDLLKELITKLKQLAPLLEEQNPNYTGLTEKVNQLDSLTKF